MDCFILFMVFIQIKGHDLVYFKDKANIVYNINYLALGRLDENKIIYFTYRYNIKN